jgi:dihydrofolate synthase/folylpolyglutamate synthase
MLNQFLEDKPLFYTQFDPLRMITVYESIKDDLPLNHVIHLVGTNGKGSTGRFIANALAQQGFHVGHYTSPHILKLNERFWRNGNDVDDASLEEAHRFLQHHLTPKESEVLSYFEYTTLLAFALFRSCEYVVLEAGLGGEFDATNVAQKTLSVFTPIGFDHQAFLGKTIDAIATTKLHAMGPKAVLAPTQQPEVIAIAQEIANEKGSVLTVVSEEQRDALKNFVKERHYPMFMATNIATAQMALKLLGLNYDLTYFKTLPLRGRFERLNEHIVIDVGHNLLAAQASIQNFDYFSSPPVLVYNVLEDKMVDEILELFKPSIKKVEIIDINDKRVLKKELLHKSLKEKAIEYANFSGIKKDENYFVFGSFKVVEQFLKMIEGKNA